MADPNVNIKITASDGASGIFERAAKNIRAMRMESRRSGENAVQTVLNSPQGVVGAVADYFGMGLQAIIVDKLGEAFKNATDKMIEMRAKLAEGKVGVGDMVVEMAKGLPILGGFVSGWLNVREMVTGEKAAIEALNKETAQNIELSKLQLSSQKAIREVMLDLATKTRHTNTATANIGADPFTQGRNNIMDARKDREDAAKGIRDAAIAKAVADADKARAILVEKAKTAQVGVSKAEEVHGGKNLRFEDHRIALAAAKQDEIIATQALERFDRTNTAKADAGKAADRNNAAGKKHEDAQLNDLLLKQYTQMIKGKVTAVKEWGKGISDEYMKQIHFVQEMAAWNEKEAKRKKAAYIEEAKDAKLVRQILLEQTNYGPFPSAAKGPGPLGGTTAAVDLVMGRGSGQSSRQREESAARDDLGQKQIKVLEAMDSKLQILVRDILNPAPAGPPVLGGF